MPKISFKFLGIIVCMLCILTTSAKQNKDLLPFISKSSLLLIGEIPDSSSILYLLKYVDTNKSEEDIKMDIISDLMSRPEFYRNIEMSLREEYLESLTKTDFIEIYLKDFFQLNEVRKQSIHWYDFHRYFKNIYQLASIINNEVDTSISIQKIQYLLIDNYIYSQINMGDDNFIMSTFQHFIKRMPTKHELSEAKKMITGQPTSLFGQNGYGKIDYIHILLNNSAYWENQIRFWSVRMLNRDPEQEEILKYLPLMHKWKTPEKMIQYLLINNLK